MVDKLKKDMKYHASYTSAKVDKRFVHNIDAPVLGFSNKNIIKDSDSVD